MWVTDPWATGPGPNGSDRAGAGYQYSKDEILRKVVDDLQFPNGIAVLPDNNTLAIGDCALPGGCCTPRSLPGHCDARHSLYWRSRRDSPPDLHHSQPDGARVPQVVKAQGAMGSSRQAGPIRSVYIQTDLRTR